MSEYLSISQIMQSAVTPVFLLAGIEATSLYLKLGQVMELEIEIPIWWVYLAFPSGFAIMAIFALELVLSELLALLNGRDT